MNKLGINLWNWRTGLSDDCLGLPSKVARMGFTAVELPMTVPEVSDRLADEIRDAGLAVSLCAAMGTGRDLSSFDERVRASTLAYATACLRTGAKLGATVFAGPLYAGGGKRHRLAEEDRRREWALAVENLRTVADRAADYGMCLALEPLNRYRTSVCNTAAQALAMVREIGRPNVGLHFDTYHACLEERDLTGSLEDSLKSGKVFHFHACANNRGAPGQGIVPWAEVLGLLVRYGYEGHITMETFASGGLDASWTQVLPGPDALAAQGIAYLRDFFRTGLTD